MLSLPRNLFKLNRSNILDIFLNILGFIPLGFFLAIGISETRFHSKKQIYLLTILCGFIISLIIEILQTFLPSRDSSMLDFMLNVIGTFIGVFILHIASFFEKQGLKGWWFCGSCFGNNANYKLMKKKLRPVLPYYALERRAFVTINGALEPVPPIAV